MGQRPYMRDPQTGKHRQKPDDGLYVHYPNTCSVYDASKIRKYNELFAKRSTPTLEPKLYPSRHGWVLVCYETKGFITFSAQITPKRAAWQRIEWPANFGKWDEKKVQDAIANFLWVAECELQRKPIQPKPSKP